MQRGQINFKSNNAKYYVGVNYNGGRLPQVSTTPVVNFATSTTGVIDTGGKELEQYLTAYT
jgi:hypothetical protein